MYFHTKEETSSKKAISNRMLFFQTRCVMHMSHVSFSRDKPPDLRIFPVAEEHGPLCVGIRIRSRRGNAPIIYQLTVYIEFFLMLSYVYI